MSDFLSEVYDLVLDIVRDLTAQFVSWALVFLLIGVPILVIAYYSMKRTLARRGFHLNVNWNLDSTPAIPASGNEQSESQVEVLDQQAIDRLLELSRQGAPLEAMCRQVNPEYGQWDPFQQQAFQKMIQAVVRHYSGASQPGPKQA